MPLGCFGHREPEPQWQAEFNSNEEWSAYVGERFFKELTPGSPFLLVVSRIEHDRHCLPQTSLNVCYHVGVLGHEEPLYRHVPGDREGHTGVFSYQSGISIGTERYVSSGRYDALGERGEGPLPIRHYDFHYTPVTKPIRVPLGMWRGKLRDEEETWAFALAQGLEAMEVLASRHDDWFCNDGFFCWYARALVQLGIEPLSDRVRAAFAEEKLKILRGLLEVRWSNSKQDEKMRRITYLCNAARELRFADEQEFFESDGLRYQPAVLIQDLKRLYQIE